MSYCLSVTGSNGWDVILSMFWWHDIKTNALYAALSAGCTWAAIAVQLTRGNSINRSNVKIAMIYLHSTLCIVSVTRNFARLRSWDDKIHLGCTVVNTVSLCTSPQRSNSWWPTCERNEMVSALYSKVIQHCNAKKPISVLKYGY